MTLKVLPFPFAAVLAFFEDCGGADLDDVLGPDRRPVPARIGRPGWYLEAGESWYEFPDGTAWAANPASFRHEIETIEAEERPLTDHERGAIATLLVYGNATNLRSLADRLRRDDHRIMLRNTQREATRWRLWSLGDTRV